MVEKKKPLEPEAPQLKMIGSIQEGTYLIDAMAGKQD
jgi:hypothetical protein